MIVIIINYHFLGSFYLFNASVNFLIGDRRTGTCCHRNSIKNLVLGLEMFGELLFSHRCCTANNLAASFNQHRSINFPKENSCLSLFTNPFHSILGYYLRVFSKHGVQLFQNIVVPGILYSIIESLFQLSSMPRIGSATKNTINSPNRVALVGVHI